MARTEAWDCHVLASAIFKCAASGEFVLFASLALTAGILSSMDDRTMRGLLENSSGLVGVSEEFDE